MTLTDPGRWQETIVAALRGHPRATLHDGALTRAAVLVPLIPTPGGPELLFTRRTDRVETHKGQISFPGGTVDRGDHDIVHTALREAEEEIGLPAAAITPVGLLDDLATPSGFAITPVVGIISLPSTLRINADEVEEVFMAPLAFFAESGNARSEVRRLGGVDREVWFYTYGERVVWGVTAMIIRSLLELVREGPRTT